MKLKMKLTLAVAFCRMVFIKMYGGFQRPYDAQWDARLNDILSNWKRVSRDEYSISFTDGTTDVEVWVSNEFYAFGYMYLEYPANAPYVDRWDIRRNSLHKEYRPSFKTMLRLYQYVLEL